MKRKIGIWLLNGLIVGVVITAILFFRYNDLQVGSPSNPPYGGYDPGDPPIMTPGGCTPDGLCNG